jgi:hypothetical protein
VLLVINLYHSDKKPWVLRALALFVIFTFLVTQSDVQLVSAALATTAASSIPSATDPNKSDDKIHYSQDLTELQQSLQGQASENPLGGVSPDQQQNPFAGDVPQGQVPEISTNFLTTQNPLAGKTPEGQKVAEDANGVVTVSYSDGTYFSYNKSSNKLVEICDKTRLKLDADGNPVKDANGKEVYELEVRKFEPVQSAGCLDCMSIITMGSEGAADTYQTFTLKDGELDKLFETGQWLSGVPASFVPEVRYSGDLVTLYDRTSDPSYYIERTYQQLPAGASRLVSYQKVQQFGEQARAVLNLEIEYDDQKGTLTVIDRSQPEATASETVNFWVYKLTDRNKRGELIAVGEMENKLAGGKILSRMDITATTYSITYPQIPNALLSFERLPEGGFGRVLRYRLDGINLEYVYEKDATGNETMTVLNYNANTYVKMSFIEGTAPDASSGLIESFRNVLESGTFTLTGTNPQYKKLLEKAPNGEWIVIDPSDGRIFDVYADFPSDEWGGLIRSRGPPSEDASTLVDYRYEYDATNRRVYAYDGANGRYALYDLTDPKNPRLLEQGDIVLDTTGNILSRTATRTYNAEILGSVSVPETEYDTLAAFDSATAALGTFPGIAASGITPLRILMDAAAPGTLTVV